MKLSGEQVQAVVWVAFKDTAVPTRRALGQVVEMGLATAPVAGKDPQYRITQEGARELRSRDLSRERPGKRRHPMGAPAPTRGRVAA